MKEHLKNISDNFRPFRLALKRPLILLYSICALWKLRLALILSILFMIFIMPPAIRSATDFVFPKHKSKKLFGLIKKKNESNDLAYLFGIYSCALIVTSANISLLILNIPKGIKSSEKFSKHCENKADNLKSNKQNRSVLLYTLASQLVVDPECQGRINKKSAEIKNEAVTDNSQTNINNSVTSGGTNGNTDYIEESKRYKLISNIGRGAMGVVNLATDQVLERKVAIKELPSSLIAEEQMIQRFKQEATALARLSHQNIVQVYDLIISQNRIYMVLEYVKGKDLSEYLDENGQLGIDESVVLISKISSALAVAHERGIVHRDIKPANILLDENNEPKITDFGIARLSTNSTITREGQAIGSPTYMSPEQCSGKFIDYRTDIYSLGITFFELLTGTVPFEGDLVSVLSQHLTKPPCPPSEKAGHISSEIDSLILSMLEKDVDKRIQSASELSQRLSALKLSAVNS